MTEFYDPTFRSSPNGSQLFRNSFGAFLISIMQVYIHQAVSKLPVDSDTTNTNNFAVAFAVILSTFMLAEAYHKGAFTMKYNALHERTEVCTKMGSADARAEAEASTTYEAQAYSHAYCNALYSIMTLTCSLFLFRALPVVSNVCISIALPAFVTYVVSSLNDKGGI